MTTGKTAWLKCSVGEGMLPGEYAVEVETVNAGRVSLFAPNYRVDVARGLLSVKQFDSNEFGVLVRLPAPPFEISNQNVRVNAVDLEPFETERKK